MGMRQSDWPVKKLYIVRIVRIRESTPSVITHSTVYSSGRDQ